MAKVFLSYRHECDANHPDHQFRVRELGEKLRAAKLEVVLDQFFVETYPGGPDEGWPKWCEDRVTDADKILIVASAGYFRCYSGTQDPGSGLGAACEVNAIRNEVLYRSGYATNKLRIVHFDVAHTATVPSPISHIHRFDAGNPEHLLQLIAWLGGDSSAVAPSSVDVPAWPASLVGYQPDLANRENEFDSFVDMLVCNALKRAVFFNAEGNHGKTTLLAECMKYALRILPSSNCVTVDFKVSGSKQFILDTLRLDLAAALPNFSKASGTVGDLRQDLRLLAAPTLLLFDTYEKSDSDARELVSTLLADLGKTPALRIVVAGRIVPDHATALWAPIVRNFQLGPIKDTAKWRKYAAKHFPKLSHDHIAAITSISQGVPGSQLGYFMAVTGDLPP